MIQSTNELQQQQQKLTHDHQASLLSEYGALLMQHCRLIQQALQDVGPMKDPAGRCGDNLGGEDRDGGRANRLRSSLQVLALHSGYSSRFFDLFRSELRACLSLEASAHARVAHHREASRLLKEVCLRSKEMSHDVIKASRELVNTFRSEHRAEDRRRSGSILSRARDIAKATIGRRSLSRSGIPATLPDAMPGQPASPLPAAQQSPQPRTVHPSPPQHHLVDLERSPRARSSQRGSADEPQPQPPKPKQKAPQVACQRVPAPPRRSSSLNSLPPELQAALPIEREQKKSPQQRHQLRQPHAGSLISRFQCTENCLKTVVPDERHQLVRVLSNAHPLLPQHQQTLPASNPTCRSAGSSAASSAATADLPSDASLSSTEDDKKAAESKGKKDNHDRSSAKKKASQRPEKMPRHNCSTANATTDMDVRLLELDENTVTKVTYLTEDETSFFNNVSEILSTSVAAGWAMKLTAPNHSSRMSKLNHQASTLPADLATVSDTEPGREEARAAATAGLGVVRQRKSATLSSTSSASGSGTAPPSSKPRSHHQQRRRRQLSSRKAAPLLSGGSRQVSHPQQQPHHSQQPQLPEHPHRHLAHNMFSDSSDSSCGVARIPVNKAETIKSVMSATAATPVVGDLGTKLLACGIKETDL